jgi:hypothetical protein
MARPTRVDTEQELLAAIGAPPPGTCAIALVGGADNLDDGSREPIAAFFRTLATALDAAHIVLVDGGTDSGIMRLVAQARRATGATFRLLGVAPRGRIGKPTRTGSIVTLAKGHPELLLVPGTAFGDETPWLFRAADHLAGGRAPTLVVNGGRLTLAEAIRRLTAGGPVVVVEGSGRAADVLARAIAAGGRLGDAADEASDEEFRPFPVELVETANLRLVGLSASVEELIGALGARSGRA